MFENKKSEKENYLTETMIQVIYPEIIKSIMYDKVEEFKMLTSKLSSWQLDEITPSFNEVYYTLSSHEFKIKTISTDFMKKRLEKEFALLESDFRYGLKDTLLYQILNDKDYFLYEEIHKQSSACRKKEFVSFVMLVSENSLEPHLNFFKEIVKNKEYKEEFKELLANRVYSIFGAKLNEFKSYYPKYRKLLNQEDLKEVFTKNLTLLSNQKFRYISLDVLDLSIQSDLVEINNAHLSYLKSIVKPQDFPTYEKLLLNQKIKPSTHTDKKLKI